MRPLTAISTTRQGGGLSPNASSSDFFISGLFIKSRFLDELYTFEARNVFIYIEFLVRRFILHNESCMFQCNYLFEKMMLLIQSPDIAFIFTGTETKTGVCPYTQGNLFPDIVNYIILYRRQ